VLWKNHCRVKTPRLTQSAMADWMVWTACFSLGLQIPRNEVASLDMPFQNRLRCKAWEVRSHVPFRFREMHTSYCRIRMDTSPRHSDRVDGGSDLMTRIVASIQLFGVKRTDSHTSANGFSQFSHLWGFSPLCFLEWVVRLPFCPNFLLQPSCWQAKGFSPVWVRKCLSRSNLRLNTCCR
jgi:hypothetical protein